MGKARKEMVVICIRHGKQKNEMSYKCILDILIVLMIPEQRTIFRQVTIFRHLFLIPGNFFIFL